MSDEAKPRSGRRGPPADPDSKRSRGLDRHADPRLTFHAEEELVEALAAYLESLPHAPGRSQVIRDALRAFLKAKGFYPPKKKGE
jgi:hypothetical protein